MWVDSHCHLNFADFREDFAAVVERARASGVRYFLNISCRFEEFEDVGEIARTHPDFFASVGIHPHETTPTQEKFPDWYQRLTTALQQPKVVALGETGLDYYYNNSTHEDQEAFFRSHCALSLEHDLPLIIHTRDAEEDTMRILRDYPGVRGVFHCFSGSAWLAEEALQRGFYLSFSGIVTFKKAEDLRAVAEKTPLDRLLVETDAPYLAPVPHRGKRNEPAFVVETGKFLAELKGIEPHVFAEQTTQNFFKVFTKAQQ